MLHPIAPALAPLPPLPPLLEHLHCLAVRAEHVHAHHRLAKRGVGGLDKVIVNVLLRVGVWRGVGALGERRAGLCALRGGATLVGRPPPPCTPPPVQ